MQVPHVSNQEAFLPQKGPGEFSLRGHAVASASYLLFVPIALQLAFDRLRSL